MSAKELIAAVMNDPEATYWLKDAITASLKRDCVDALRDADTLAELLQLVCDEQMEGML